MSKERLEEIKELINKYQDCYNGEIALRYARDLMRYHAKWLIKQAERAEELDRIIKTHAPEGRNYTNAQYVNLLQQNKRYREALEFYADSAGENIYGIGLHDYDKFQSDILEDNGRKARKALEREEG